MCSVDSWEPVLVLFFLSLNFYLRWRNKAQGERPYIFIKSHFEVKTKNETFNTDRIQTDTLTFFVWRTGLPLRVWIVGGKSVSIGVWRRIILKNCWIILKWRNKNDLIFYKLSFFGYDPVHRPRSVDPGFRWLTLHNQRSSSHSVCWMCPTVGQNGRHCRKPPTSHLEKTCSRF